MHSSKLGDIRLWVGPRIEHLLSTWDLTTRLVSCSRVVRCRHHGVEGLWFMAGELWIMVDG